MSIILGSTWELFLWVLGTGSDLTLWLLRVIRNSTGTWKWDQGEGKEYQGTPEELLERGLFMRRMPLEPSPEQIRGTRKGEGQGWQLCRLGLLFKWSYCIKTSFLKGIACSEWHLSETAGLSWDCSSSSSLQRVKVVKTELYIYFQLSFKMLDSFRWGVWSRALDILPVCSWVMHQRETGSTLCWYNSCSSTYCSLRHVMCSVQQ